MINQLDIAKLVQENLQGECEAIIGYTELLSNIRESYLSSNLTEYSNKIISQIVSSELKHQELLNELYSKLTEIIAEN